MNENRSQKIQLTLSLLALLTLACSPPEPPPEEENPNAEGCEHLEDGPAVAVVDDMGSPPDVASDHRRYDIPLGSGTPSAVVELRVADAGDYLLFLNRDVPLTITQGGSAVAFEESLTGVEECEVVKARHLVPLAVGTATLEFGATTETSVGLVIEPAAHAHDHGEEP